jgi:hypothetical protein
MNVSDVSRHFYELKKAPCYTAEIKPITHLKTFPARGHKT